MEKGEWGREDSNLRRLSRRFYRPLPLAARAHPRESGQFSRSLSRVVLGIGLIAYSLFTNYELGLWKVAPMAVHNLIDIAAGSLLAASPWIFGFADGTANVWVPHVVVGLAAIGLGLTTKQSGGYSYRRAATTA